MTTNLRLIILAIILAIPFAYYVDLSIYEAAFIEVSYISQIGLSIFGLFFAGVSLIYSLFWLEKNQIFSLLKQIILLVVIFEILSIIASYMLIHFLSFNIIDFQVQSVDAIHLTNQDVLARISPLFFFKHPVYLWFTLCLIIGISISKLFSNRFQINAFLTVLMSTMKQIFRVFEYFAPIPIFFLIVVMLKHNRFELTYEMLLYILVYITGAFAFIFYLIPMVWGMKVKARTTDFYRLMVYPSIFAFGFGELATALPIFFYLASEVKSSQKDKEKMEAAGLIIPITYTFFPLANSLLLIIPLLVLNVTGQATGFFEHIHYTIVGIFILATPSVAGPGALSMLFDILKLPQDATSIYAELLPIIKHLHAFINSFSLGFIFLYVLSDKQSSKGYNFKKLVMRALRYTAYFCFALVIMYFGVQAISELKKQSDIERMQQLKITQKASRLKDSQIKKIPTDKIRSLQEIIQSGVLRVGYRENTIPFSYLNIEGEIVGFDIELAHLLATDLQCNLHLIPINYDNVIKHLTYGEIDVAVGALSVTVDRLKKINFTDPIVIAEKVLVVKDHQRFDYEDPDEVIKNTKFKIAFLEGSSFEGYAKEMFPNATYVPLKSYNEFLKKNVADALFWSRQEGFHWTQIHPNYTMVSLRDYPPPTRDILAFGIAYTADELAPFINHWLQLQENNQVMDELRNKWKVPITLPR